MKRKLLGLAIFLSWITFLPVSKASEKYSFQDLEILSEQKNYWEFLQHAKDVKPSQRNKHWVELVQNMATELINFNIRSQNFGANDYDLIHRISRWPILKSDEFFQVKHNQYMLHYTRHCLMDPKQKDCARKANQFWRLSNKDPETGYQIAQSLRGFRPNHNIWNILRAVALHPMAGFYCHRRFMTDELTKQLLNTFRPFIIPGKTGPSLTSFQIQQRLDGLMHHECWKSLLPQLKQSLILETPRHQMILHKILKIRQALTQSEADFFYTLYLLRGPLVGETFNQAWNALFKIGQNFKRRTTLLETLKKRDPLEGKVFASTNQNLQKTIIRHFSQNFPEYLDYYGKTCLEYLEGKKTFPYGNPTLECKELFQKSSGTKWIAQPLHLRFSGLKK